MTKISPAVLVAAILAALPFLGSIAEARTPERMMQECRNRAHEVMHVRLPDVETKYEGQRTDGTHAVNGTVRARGRIETFQCSFERSGRQIIQFIVNNPTTGGSAQQLPETEPLTSTQQVDFRGNPYQQFQGTLNPGDSVRYVFRDGNRKFLDVHFRSRNRRAYFNIFTPDRQTLYESARAGNDYRGQLWLDGEHVVEVYNISQDRAPYSLDLELD
jgi:hypothetical protein